LQAENQFAGNDVSSRIRDAIRALRSGNANFEHAHDTYVQQYGNNAVTVNAPLELSGTIDPTILVFGQTSFVQFRDSTKRIAGTLGSTELASSNVYIVGRRQPQDSKLVLWDSRDNSELDLEEYDARSSVIPSRIHGAFATLGDGRTLYTDLSSSSGTLILGELKRGGPFVRIYDPGPESFPRFKVDRISTARSS
jgi:hypothetical protein